MAIAPTGAIYKSLSFDGKNSRDYGVYITGEAVYNAPERDVELVTIPGRNGSFALDNGRFENIEVTYPAGIFAYTEEDFRQAISDFRNLLCSRKGYVRLSDEYNPDEYRMAVYKSGLDVSPAQLKAGEFDITFDCKPQRFLVSGETEQTADDWSDVETETGSIVTIEADDTTAIKDLTADIEPIQDLHGYSNPWVGGAGKNKFTPDFTYIGKNWNGGANASRCYMTIPMPQGTYTISLSDASTAFNTFSGIDIGRAKVAMPFSNVTSETDRLQITSSSTTLNKTVTIDSEYPYIYVAFLLSSGTITEAQINSAKVQVEQGSSATAWTPYENICPISGHTDVVVGRTNENLIAESGKTWNVDSSGKIVNDASQNSVIFKIVEGVQYWVKITSGAGNNVYGFFADYPVVGAFTYDGSRVVTGNNTISFTAPITGFCVLRGASGKTVEMVNSGSALLDTVTADSEVKTISLGTTVYGGTLDVTTGVLTVTHAIVDMGDLSWNRTTSYTNPLFYTSITAKGTETDGTLSSAFHTLERAVASASNFSSYSADGDVASSNGNTQVYVRWDAITDKTTFTTNVTGQKLVYPLATPTTTTLTAQQISTLLGENNVWASSGDVTVEYGVPPFTNPTMFPSNPLIKVTGIGTLTVGDTSIVITGTASQVIYIDCESMEIYKIIGGVITPAGSLVSFSTPDFPKLMPGLNIVTMGTGITDVEITPRWWRI